jgi:hypothetical protein
VRGRGSAENHGSSHMGKKVVAGVVVSTMVLALVAAAASVFLS